MLYSISRYTGKKDSVYDITSSLWALLSSLQSISTKVSGNLDLSRAERVVDGGDGLHHAHDQGWVVAGTRSKRSDEGPCEAEHQTGGALRSVRDLTHPCQRSRW